MLDRITERRAVWAVVEELLGRRGLNVTPKLRRWLNDGYESEREMPKLFCGTAEHPEGTPDFWRIVEKCQQD